MSVRRREMTLAGQLLILQLLIMLLVLVVVGAISIAQASRAIERSLEREVLSAAENLAAQPLVRDRTDTATPGTDRSLAAAGEAIRSVSGADTVVVARLDRTVLASSDPTLVGHRLPTVNGDVLVRRAHTGRVDRGGRSLVIAQVPVQDARTGDVIGLAEVGREFPSIAARLELAAPNLATYLGVATLLGVAGSLLLANRVKRQTLGMEPTAIAALVEHREALLHGVKEGVIALDEEERITVANDSARAMLDLPPDCVGRTLVEVGASAPVRDVLTRRQLDPDRLVLVGDRVLAGNRMPVLLHGRTIGAVTTLRDRTELSALERELGTTRATTDTLRAQAHGFANQLHTISGLIQLKEYDEAVRFIDGVQVSNTRLADEVTSRVRDASVAALLIAESTLAAERGVRFRLDPASRAGDLEPALSRDVTAVLGNLVDNAIDAVTGCDPAAVTVRLDHDADELRIEVRDTGPGVPAGSEDSVFTQGFSTKPDDTGHGRGFGLALTRVICRQHGGDVTVRNDHGAVFTAVLHGAREA